MLSATKWRIAVYTRMVEIENKIDPEKCKSLFQWMLSATLQKTNTTSIVVACKWWIDIQNPV